MGKIITMKELELSQRAGILQPIIYSPQAATQGNMGNAFSINGALAERLLKCREKRRSMRMENILDEIIREMPSEAVIQDFDVMFNPDYKIDVLQILIQCCKRKKFSVLWPGRYEDGKLYYAEEGFPDYKVFNITDYDITCVI